jgi:hypothetical protein
MKGFPASLNTREVRQYQNWEKLLKLTVSLCELSRKSVQLYVKLPALSETELDKREVMVGQLRYQVSYFFEYIHALTQDKCVGLEPGSELTPTPAGYWDEIVDGLNKSIKLWNSILGPAFHDDELDVEDEPCEQW